MFFGVAHEFHLPKLSAAIQGLRSSNEMKEPAPVWLPQQLPSARPLGRGPIAVQKEQGCLRLRYSLDRSFFRVASLARRGLPSNKPMEPTR